MTAPTLTPKALTPDALTPDETNSERAVSAAPLATLDGRKGLKAPSRVELVREQLAELTTQEVREIVNARFVFCEKIADAIARGLRSGKNVLLWGPTGHAKSAVVRDIIKGLELDDVTFVQDFGEGTDEASLWGGYNFKRMKEEHILDYHPERSFLNSEIAIFEEVFDAPPQVLCSLKNTLTAKCLFKSADPFPSKNRLIIAMTNKSPEEIVAMGESYKAFVDRFPLVVKVDWEEYSEKTYGKMFQVLNLGGDTMRREFAKLIAEAGKKGRPISPRTAVQAFEIVLNAAEEFGAFDERALAQLELIPGLEETGRKKAGEWQERIQEAQFASDFETWENMRDAGKDLLKAPVRMQEVLDMATALQALEEELVNCSVPTKHQTRVATMQKEVTSLVESLTKRTIELNKIIRENSDG